MTTDRTRSKTPRLLNSLGAAVVFACGALMLSALVPAAEPAESDLLKTFVAEFVEIAPGQKSFPKSFIQGADKKAPESPAHEVTLAQPFAIAKYEVPQNLYESVMGTNPSKWKGPRNSVEMVSWYEAVAFCRKITDLLRAKGLIAQDEVIRLPTESEWEYCCRAGTKTAYSFGDQATAATDSGPKASLLNAYGWHNGNAQGNDPPVGALKPNPWGLHDVHGYLWEYCADEWHKDYDGAPANGDAWVVLEATEAGKRSRVIRGGSWKDQYPHLTSTARREIGSADKDDAVGFRCVKSKVVAQ